MVAKQLVPSGVIGRGWQLGVAVCFLVVAPLAAAEPEAFSGKRAFGYLKAICELGPRPSGSPGMLRQRQQLIDHFHRHGGKVFRQAFRSRDGRTGEWVRMENLLIHWHPERTERVLLGVHYDTRPFPDRDLRQPRGVFLGANDGASGVAVLMELAAAMASLPGPIGVDFVCFDAEEFVFDDARDRYCLGSLYFARQYAAEQRAGTAGHRYRCGVVLDMVADRNLEIWQERQSVDWADTRPVVASIWATARRLGVRQFVPRPKHFVNDDHVPLRVTGGIPTCDVIDFDYPHWHTTRDTPENCSAESLEAVGSVMLAWLEAQR